MDISANIFSTVQTGLATYEKLFDLSEKTGAAGREVIQLVTQISLLSSTLDQLRSTITQGDNCRYSIGAVALIQKILERCQEIYDELDAISERVKPGYGRVEDLILRMRCEFEKTEVKVLTGTLEACNITMHLIQHNLATAKKATRRRHSSFNIEIEDEQRENIAQALQLSRQTTISTLERLENGENSLQAQSSTRSTNKLRKIKPPSKRNQFKYSENSNTQKERASDWVKNLVRLERNNLLISLEFSPRVMGDDTGAEDLRRERVAEGGGSHWVKDGSGMGIGELQGDGPDDVPSRSERMEYSRGWPSS